MSYSLEPDATRFFLSKSVPGNPNIKKPAARMADRVTALFIRYLDLNLNEAAKGKTITPEDVVKALGKLGLDHYIDAFKKGMEGEEEEEEEEEETTKKGREKGEEKKKSKKK